MCDSLVFFSHFGTEVSVSLGAGSGLYMAFCFLPKYSREMSLYVSISVAFRMSTVKALGTCMCGLAPESVTRTLELALLGCSHSG